MISFLILKFYLNVNNNFAHYGSKYPCICHIPNNWRWCTKQHHKHVCHSQIYNENICYRLHGFCCSNCYKNLKRKYIKEYRIKSIVWLSRIIICEYIREKRIQIRSMIIMICTICDLKHFIEFFVWIRSIHSERSECSIYIIILDPYCYI